MTRAGGTIRRKFTAKSNGTAVLDAEAVAERQLARQLARAETPANIEHLKQIADNPDSSSADRIRAMRLLAEIGGMVGRDRPDEVPLLNVPLVELSREEIVIRAWHEMQSLVQRHRMSRLLSTSATTQLHSPISTRSSRPWASPPASPRRMVNRAIR